MKYLLCMLDDENYTDPTFQIYDTKEQALKSAFGCLSNLFKKEGSKIEVSHREEKTRITWNCRGRFLVIELIPYEEEGDYLLLWHHAYDGVEFEILSQATTYQECVEERIRQIKKLFEEEDLSNGDNEDFDINTDTCIDTGSEWEIFSIVTREQI